jgi:hypothetical protein
LKPKAPSTNTKLPLATPNSPPKKTFLPPLSSSLKILTSLSTISLDQAQSNQIATSILPRELKFLKSTKNFWQILGTVRKNFSSVSKKSKIFRKQTKSSNTKITNSKRSSSSETKSKLQDIRLFQDLKA